MLLEKTLNSNTTYKKRLLKILKNHMNGWLTKVRTRMLAIPVDTNGWCVVANEIKDESKGESNDRPKMWLCTCQCRRLSDEEVDIIIKTKLLFTKPVAGIRVALGDLGNFCHIDRDLSADICDENCV